LPRAVLDSRCDGWVRKVGIEAKRKRFANGSSGGNWVFRRVGRLKGRGGSDGLALRENEREMDVGQARKGKVNIIDSAPVSSASSKDMIR